jgi:hypothetical protein
LVKHLYDYNIDHAIIDALFKYDKNSMSQRRFKWIIESKEYLNKVIPKKTFRYHMKKLLNANYIDKENRDNDKHYGKKAPLSLTPSTHEQKSLGTLVIQYKENNEEIENKRQNKVYQKLKKRRQETRQRAEVEFKHRMIYYIIFRVMSIDTPNRHYKHHGLSVAEIMNARYDGHAFYYLRLEEDRSTVEQCIEKLRHENIIREIKIDDEEEFRYILVEPIWKDFVKDCSELLDDTIMIRLHLVWQNIRKPTPMERLYEEGCWGKRSANGRMNRVCKTLEENRKRIGKRRLKEQTTELIECLDSSIVKDVRELRKKYHNLIERYTWTCNEIIKTVYPEFIQNEVEQIVKNEKTKYKNYPKLQSIFVSDVLEFGDSTKSKVPFSK